MSSFSAPVNGFDHSPGIQKKPGQSVNQLKEDKCIILYLLNKIKTGCSREQLADIILRNIQFNYFDLQVYIDELIKDGFIQTSEDTKGKKVLSLSSEGKNTINTIFTFIPAYIRELIDLYLDKNQSRLHNCISVNADYTLISPGNYEAVLSLAENDLRLIEMRINAPTENDALELCKKWKSDYQQVYANIMNSFN